MTASLMSGSYAEEHTARIIFDWINSYLDEPMQYLDVYRMALTSVYVYLHKSKSNAELKKIDNAIRIEVDKEMLKFVGQNLVVLSKDELKTLFDTTDETMLKGNSSKPYGVAIFDYDIANTGDDGQELKINLRKGGGGAISNEQAIEWMSHKWKDYHRFDMDTSNYTKQNAVINRRYFYSDDAIAKAPVEDITGVQSATVRVKFTFDEDGNTTSAILNLTRNYQQGGWKRIVCEGLADVTIKREDVM